MRKSTAKKLVLSVLGGIVFMAGTAGAATSYWGSASGNFTNSASWQSGGVPQAADSAFFANDAAYTVTFSADWTNNTATFNGPTQLATLDIGVVGGVTNTWKLVNEFRVGYQGKTGRVSIVSGNLNVASNAIGKGVGTGTVTTQVGSSNNVVVVSNGATVHSGRFSMGLYGPENNASNLVHVTGAGSAWYVDQGGASVGELYGSGNTLRISDGGYMRVWDNSFAVGSGYPSANTLIVEGSGSMFEFVSETGNKICYCRQNNTYIVRDNAQFVGRYAAGQTTRRVYMYFYEYGRLLIQSGGNVRNEAQYGGVIRFKDFARCEVGGGGTLGANTAAPLDFINDSELIVTGPASKVTGPGDTYFSDRAYYELSAAATNDRTRTYFAYNVGSDTDALITGAGTQHGGVNYIGYEGIATMTVTNSGTLQASGITVGNVATAAGSELILYDGTIVCAGTVSANYGKVSVRGVGGSLTAGTLVMAATSELEFIAGASGFSQIQPGTLTVASGAKLTVDAQSWLVDSEVVTNLVVYTSMSADFSDVSVTVADGYTGSIRAMGAMTPSP
jgi:T5SS/PEP-CTERM-associated repeat protein